MLSAPTYWGVFKVDSTPLRCSVLMLGPFDLFVCHPLEGRACPPQWSLQIPARILGVRHQLVGLHPEDWKLRRVSHATV